MSYIAKILIILSILFICSCGDGRSDKGEEVAQKAQIFQTLLAGLRFDGVDLAGGKVYFYSPGTTTEKAVYIDRDKTIEAANPYTLDVNGQAGIYGDGVYDIKVTTAAGVEKAYWYNVSMIDPVAYGVDATAYSSLAAAVAAIGATNVELNISDTQAVTANLTIPSNIALIIRRTGKISVSTGVTLTINGPFQSGLYQCFEGAGNIMFGGISVHETYPEWFGAVGDGTTDDTVAINRAISAHLPVRFMNKEYALNITIGNGTHLYGQVGYEIGTAYSVSGTILKPYNIANPVITIDDGDPTDGVIIDGISFIGGGTSHGIYMQYVRQSCFKNLRFNNFNTCIYSNQKSWLNKFENIKMFNFVNGFYFNSGSEDTQFTTCIARGYKTNSVGFYLNYYANLNNFDTCDFSDNLYNVRIVSSLSAAILTFNSCIFEQGQAAADNSIGVYANSSTPVIINVIGSRLYYKVNDTHRTSSIAFLGDGAGGNIVFNIIGTKIVGYPVIFKSNTANSIAQCYGDVYIDEGYGGSYTLYSGTFKNKQIRVNNDSVKNLLGEVGTYDSAWDFASGNLVIDASTLGTGGRAKLYINLNGAPDKYGEFTLIEKGYYTNAAIYEDKDPGSVYTVSTSGNTITIVGSTSFTSYYRLVKF